MMRVILVNGSPRKEMCTYTALSEVASALERGGVETEILYLGSEPVRDCTACRAFSAGAEMSKP